MNILVCISSVPDTTSPINFVDDNKKFDTNGITLIINPYDEFCLTKAVFIKENIGASITVLNVGSSTNDPVLRKALAIGADRAVRINQNPENSQVVAECIFNYCTNNKFDIIFCGRESIDYNGGKVPGFLANKLNIPFINACIDLEINGETLELKREIDNGYELVESSCPALIAGQKGLVEEKDLRIPSMRGIMTSRTKPLEVIESQVALDNKIEIVSHEKPAKRSECKMISADNVVELVDALANDAKII